MAIRASNVRAQIRRVIKGLAVAAAITAGIPIAAAFAQDATNPNEVLGSKFHPFSACHLGLGGGMGYARMAASTEYTGIGSGTGTATLPLGGDGLLGLITGGCDMHFGRVVAGGFAQYNFGDISARVLDTSIDINSQSTFGGRLGYMVKSDLLVYGSLGISWGKANFTWTDTAMSQSLKGVRVGLGTEYKIAAPVWLRLDGAATRYDSVSLGTDNFRPVVYSATAAVIFKF